MSSFLQVSTHFLLKYNILQFLKRVEIPLQAR